MSENERTKRVGEFGSSLTKAGTDPDMVLKAFKACLEVGVNPLESKPAGCDP